MCDAPERIWAYHNGNSQTYLTAPNKFHNVEYVRADLASPAPSLPEDVERVVERFEITHDPDIGMIHRPHPHGYYVRYSDYSDLQRQLAEARANFNQVSRTCGEYLDQIDDLKAERDRLAAENEAFRAALEGIAAPAIFFLSREDAIKMRNQARAALASLEDRT